MSLPPSEIPSGAMRFNSDSQKLEYWDGSQWVQVHTFSPNLNGGARGVWAGGLNPGAGGYQDVIDYANISSTGDATDFGDLTGGRGMLSGLASNTRAVFMGGYTPPRLDTIDYITIASTGDAIDFGDLITATARAGAASNQTRGIYAGGDGNAPLTAGVTTINYITIASTSDSIDFGELTAVTKQCGSVASPTRGVFGAGQNPGFTNVIHFVTIASLGDAQDFGDTTVARATVGGASNSIRGLFMAGNIPGNNTNIIDYITIATTGNAVDFGDLTGIRNSPGCCASSTRGLSGGGGIPGYIDVMDYVNILSQGNAIDFGDLTQSRNNLTAASNAHGGL